MNRVMGYYLAGHHCLAHHWRVMVIVVLIMVLAGLSGLTRLHLDLSFRPMFAAATSESSATRDFEQQFGQLSGEQVIFLVEHSAILGDRFLADLQKFSAALAGVNGIVDVESLVSQRVARISATGTRMKSSPLSREEMADSALLSRGGDTTLVLARLRPPMEELEQRRRIIRDLQRVAEQTRPRGSRLHITGVSVVEAAYARQILRDQLLATSLTSGVLLLLLGLFFRHWKAVAIVMLPTSLAVPMTLGVMGWMGYPVTIITSIIPAIVLVMGVADAVHMLVEWSQRSRDGAEASIERMLRATGTACALTTITTAAGFLALQSAQLDVIREFGLAAACGVLLTWLFNQLLLPLLLLHLSFIAHFDRGWSNRQVARTLQALHHLAAHRPRAVVCVTALLLIPAIALSLRINTDQRFNEELSTDNPVRRNQQMLEQQFGGFLGPELDIRLRGDGTLLDAEKLAKIDKLLDALRAVDGTQSIASLRDLLPEGLSGRQAALYLNALADSPGHNRQLRARIDPEYTRMALQLRVPDLGNQWAQSYQSEVLTTAKRQLGPEFQVDVVGQWWLAQQGMQMILGDMLRSLFTALLVVLPILALSLGSWRLFMAATVVNLLPLLTPLAVMGALGIKLRIGTAVVMAVALGIAVDNTIHVSQRLRVQSKYAANSTGGSTSVDTGVGRAVAYTSLALIAGFLSMQLNALLAIRDMGLVAALTFASAAIADVLLLPALYRLLIAHPTRQSPPV